MRSSYLQTQWSLAEYFMCHSVMIYIIYKDSNADKMQFSSLN